MVKEKVVIRESSNSSNKNRKYFFDGVRTEDLKEFDDFEVAGIACCQTKRLAYELFKFAAANKGFPYNDPELMRRAEAQQLNVNMMRPYNEFAIKLMRKLGKSDL